MVETNVIRENFYRTARSGTHSQFAQIGNEERNFEQITQEILNWINNIESVFPPYVKNVI